MLNLLFDVGTVPQFLCNQVSVTSLDFLIHSLIGFPTGGWVEHWGNGIAILPV